LDDLFEQPANDEAAFPCSEIIATLVRTSKLISPKASMTSAVDKVRRAFGNPQKPTAIWQEPFDHNSSHYKRLCNLVGKPPTGFDLVDYSDDIHYQESLQPDLFKFLFPLCLESWRQYLLEDKSEYGAFAEHFELTLSRRSYCPKLLSETEHEAVIDFFVDCILERMSRESSLSHRGMGASPHKWVEALDFFAEPFLNLSEFGLNGGHSRQVG
jgi:hypothetical protein